MDEGVQARVVSLVFPPQGGTIVCFLNQDFIGFTPETHLELNTATLPRVDYFQSTHDKISVILQTHSAYLSLELRRIVSVRHFLWQTSPAGAGGFYDPQDNDDFQEGEEREDEEGGEGEGRRWE